MWRDIQAYLAEHFLQPVFEEWLRMAILTGFLCTMLVGGYKVLQGDLNVGAYGLTPSPDGALMAEHSGALGARLSIDRFIAGLWASIGTGRGHLHVPHVAVRQHLRRVFVDQRSVRDQNGRQAAAVDVVHDLEQIATHQRFATGERHVLQFGLFEDLVDEPAYLLRR